MKVLLTGFIATGLLFGCGGGSETTSDTSNAGSDGGSSGGETNIAATTNLNGSYQYLGFVEIIQDNLLDRVNRDTNFLRMTSPQSANVFSNSVPMAVDTCSLKITPTIPTDVGVIGFPDAAFILVSAGESVTLTSDSGTYATLDLMADRFEVATYPVPSPLTLDIPGEVFPAFSNVAMPDVVAVQNFQPGNNDPLEANTEITWIPTGLVNHHINLAVFDFPASDKVVDLRCSMADDGLFTLPANIVDALNSSLGSGFALDGAAQDLRTDALFIEGDALLVATRRLQ